MSAENLIHNPQVRPIVLDVVKVANNLSQAVMSDGGFIYLISVGDIDIDGNIITIYRNAKNARVSIDYTSGTLNTQGTSTPQELVAFWKTNAFFFDLNVSPLIPFDHQVNTYNDLPDPSLWNGEFYIVLTTIKTGVWPLRTVFSKGVWRSNGVIWEFKGADIPAYLVDDTLLVKDNITGFGLGFTLDALTADRLATWQDRAGIVAFLQTISNFMSTGLRSFGGLAANVDPKRIDLGEIKAFFVDNTTDVQNAIPIEKTFAAQTGYLIQSALPPAGDEIVVYLSVDINGTIIETPVQLDGAQNRDYVQLGFVVIDDIGDIIFFLNESTNFILDPILRLFDHSASQGTYNISGNIVTPNANLTFGISSGKIYQSGAAYFTTPKDPDRPLQVAENPVSYISKLSNGTDLGSKTNVEPNVWDDGTSTPAAVPVNDYSVQRIARFGNAGAVELQLGQETFNNKADAILAIDLIEREFVVPNDSKLAVPLYWLVIKQGTIDLTNLANAEFIPALQRG